MDSRKDRGISRRESKFEHIPQQNLSTDGSHLSTMYDILQLFRLIILRNLVIYASFVILLVSAFAGIRRLFITALPLERDSERHP